MGHIRLSHPEHHEGPNPFQVEFIVPWANATIKRLSRRQKKALKKYRQTKRPKDLARMKKLQKAQRAECRRAYHQYLMGILDPDAGKSKLLYSYVKSLKKDSSTVGPLRNSEGIDPPERRCYTGHPTEQSICVSIHGRGHHGHARPHPRPIPRHGTPSSSMRMESPRC